MLRRHLVLVLGTLLLTCGCVASEPADPSEATSTTTVPIVPTPSGPTTYAPQECSWSMSVPDPASSGSSTDGVGGADAPNLDSPPNHADNNGWKQRRDLSSSDRRIVITTAQQLRGVVQPTCERGDFSLDRARAALEPYGGKSVVVTPLTSASGDTSVGYVFALQVGEIGCIIGDARPGRVSVTIDGPTGEGSCFEPVSH